MLTIAYMTSRKDPKSTWFFSSLERELYSTGEPPNVVVVDFHWSKKKLWKGRAVRVPPKPTPWQGEYRLTKENYFAAANARNTALCYAPDGWICFVDDLSVLMPGWLSRVKAAMEGNYIACGAYRKVLELSVKNGLVDSFKPFDPGLDNRANFCKNDELMEAKGQWLFGCSVVMPVEAALKTNGWNEACDGLGFEDVLMGLALEQHGYKMMYDPKMLTLESEEDHHLEPAFKKYNPKNVQGEEDAAWALLRRVQNGQKVFPNYFGEGGIVELRKKILAGGKFPTEVEPHHHWATGVPLSEL